MSKVRYINAHECQTCFNTFATEKESNDCCGADSTYLLGYECKQCFKLHKNSEEARHCHPDPKPMSYKDIGIDYEEPLEDEDAYDEILIGKTTVMNTKPIEVAYE